MPKDPGVHEVEEQKPEDGSLETELGEVYLSMFNQNGQVRVRVGNEQRLAEMYEAIFESADEANNALLDANVLTPEQVKDPASLAGTHIELHNITVQMLEAAGLKRHGTSTL